MWAASIPVIDPAKEVTPATSDLDGVVLIVADATTSKVYKNPDSWQVKAGGTAAEAGSWTYNYLKFIKYNEEVDGVEGDLYRLQFVNADGSANYRVNLGGWYEGYFNADSESSLVALGKNEEPDHSGNKTYSGTWKVTYVDGKGYTIQNVKYMLSGGKTYATPNDVTLHTSTQYVKLYSGFGEQASSNITWNIKNDKDEIVRTIVKEGCEIGQNYNMGISLPGYTFSSNASVTATVEDQALDVTYTVDDEHVAFKLSPDYENAIWYAATLRGYYLSWDAGADKFVCPHNDGNKTQPASLAKKDLFAFVGSDPWHLKIVNAALGEDFAIKGSTLKGVPFNEAQVFAFEDNSNHFVFRAAETTNKRLNDVSNSGTLGYWDSKDSATDGGSSFTFDEIDEELVETIMNPTESDPEILSGVKYSTVEQLTANKFFLVTNRVNMAQFINDGVAMSNANIAVATTSENSYPYFQAEAVEVDGHTYYYLHAYKKKSDSSFEAKYGWWGTGKPQNDCVNLSQWNSEFEMAQGGDNIVERVDDAWVQQAKTYGTAYNNGSLFEINYVIGQGVSFRNMAVVDGKRYYIAANGKRSESPYYWNCYDVENDKFQGYEPVQDYLELPIDELTPFGGATINGEIISMNNNANGGEWKYDTPKKWTGYKYLVVVPKRRFVKGGQVEGSDAETLDVTIKMNDHELKWIGSWNPKRACVIDLTIDDIMDYIDNVTSVKIQKGFGGGKDWSLSAAYLTNTEPTWTASNGNNGDGGDTNLGNAETTADHVRTLSATGTLGVVTLPYASAICGADAYEFVGVNDSENPTAIWVKPVTGILTAGKPYVFKTNTNLNVTFYKAGANTVAEAGSENGLVGVLADTPVTGNNYAVSGGKFKKAGEYTATVKANRAYLDIANAPVYTDPSSVKGCINLYDENEADAIQSIIKPANEGAIYDLSGRRVSNAKAGLYIVNGKKVVLK